MEHAIASTRIAALWMWVALGLEVLDARLVLAVDDAWAPSGNTTYNNNVYTVSRRVKRLGGRDAQVRQSPKQPQTPLLHSRSPFES